MAEQAAALLEGVELRLAEGEAHASLFGHSVKEAVEMPRMRMASGSN